MVPQVLTPLLQKLCNLWVQHYACLEFAFELKKVEYENVVDVNLPKMGDYFFDILLFQTLEFCKGYMKSSFISLMSQGYSMWSKTMGCIKTIIGNDLNPHIHLKKKPGST